MNKDDQRRERMLDEVWLIVADAPPEPDKHRHYVIRQCRHLEDTGLAQADCREAEERVREKLNFPQW
jgi:hypothetical protein